MESYTGSAVVLRGDARKLDTIADESVDLIVTSPPYWSLRSYTDGGEHYVGQIGAEPTPAEYIDSLIACTAEWMRVLKPAGSMWINLGDKYSTGNSGQSGMAELGQRYAGGGHTQSKAKTRSGRVGGMPQKSLIGLPWRYAIRCVDDLGLILRAEVVWSKPNGLPESVTDRVRRSHETWFHFTKEPRYFAAVDAIRQAYEPSSINRNRYAVKSHTPDEYTDTTRGVLRDSRPAGHEGNPLGKLPGSVWEIATQPLKVPAELGVDHFAAFPMEWPRRIIAGWSPSGICTACGEGRRPVVERQSAGRERGTTTGRDPSWTAINRAEWQENVMRTITGEACACPDTSAPTCPAVVVDPFGGTGTTATVAKVLGRHGVSVDMSADYCRIAEWRTTDPAQLARASKGAKR